MKIQGIGVLALMFAALAAAQDKVTVPLSSPNQPATIKVSQVHGSITVVTGQAGQVVVDTADGRTSQRKGPEPPPGMHRIDSDRGGLEVTEEHNVITIQTGRAGMGANVTITVPANASLKLNTVNGGHIDVTGVSGEIEADIVNGSIMLKNVAGSVVAHSVNGSITVNLDRITGDKPMSFTTLNGKIDVTLPSATKARLRLKSERGSIFTDFDVKLEPDSSKPTVEDGRGNDGKYRIRIDRSVYGSINGGGPEYRFESMNGGIVIRKK
jgi:DUF4097 and DUF4098 domain-containing protein YvlB